MTKVWNISAILSLKEHNDTQWQISKQYRAPTDAEANNMFFADLNEQIMELANLEEVQMRMAIDEDSPSQMIH